MAIAPGIHLSLLTLARQAGLMRWSLSFDIGVLVIVALILMGVGTVSFNRAE